ncbi:hypothetical protein T01_11022, partial [Trichinella spiralis]
MVMGPARFLCVYWIKLLASWSRKSRPGKRSLPRGSLRSWLLQLVACQSRNIWM